MGERGPVPKRSEQRIRRNKDYPEITKAEAGGHFPAPFEPDEAWHPIALEFWESLQHSGQARFYEQSDWVAAYILCEHLSRELKPQFIGLAKSFDASTGNSIETPLTMKVPLKGANLSAIRTWMASLMVTEADRRRLSIELSKVDPEQGRASTPGGAAVTSIQAKLQQRAERA